MPYYPPSPDTGAFLLRLKLTPEYFRWGPFKPTLPVTVDALVFATPRWVSVYTASPTVYFSTNIPRTEGHSVLETVYSRLVAAPILLPDRGGQLMPSPGSTCTKITTAEAHEIAQDWAAGDGLLFGPIAVHGAGGPPHDPGFRREFLRHLVTVRTGVFVGDVFIPRPTFLLSQPPVPGAWRCSPAARSRCAELADAVADAVQRLRAPLGHDQHWDAVRQVRRHLNRAAEVLGNTSVSHATRGALSDYVTREAHASPWFCASNDERLLVVCECGHVEPFGDDVVTDVEGITHCSECAEEYLREPADDPGELYHVDNLYWHDDDDEYRTYPPADDEDEDEDEDDSSGLLRGWGASCSRLDHDTTFEPSPHGEFTMGVELEAYAPDTYQGRSKALYHCDEHFNRTRQYAMFKSDGSLDYRRGFEIVTAARRLDDHIKAFEGWTPMRGMQAWDTGTCGMHIHLDSRAFTPLSIGKFLMFLNSDATTSLVRGIAGRHPRQDTQAQHYAACLDQQVLGSPKQAAAASEATWSRYRLVNLVNLTKTEADRLKIKYNRDCKGDYSTVEVRVFRATLNKKRLLAQIEFTHAAVMFCREASWGALGEGDFRAWLVSQPAYKHLRRWLGLLKAPRQTPAEAEAEA